MKYAVALVAGMVTVLAFAPFGFFPLGLIGPAVLFYLWSNTSSSQSFILGLCFGVGLFGLGVSWVYVSMFVYGNMTPPLAAVAVAIFVLILSMYPALIGTIQARLPTGGSIHIALVIPALWTLTEWLRGWFLSGFPWLSLGYGQLDGPLESLSQWIGVFGVTWVTATGAGLVVIVFTTASMVERLTSILLIAAMFATGWAAGLWSWVEPAGTPLKVAIVQGNVSLEDKWKAGGQAALLEKYLDLSEPLQQADLVVWPEAALPFYEDQLPEKFWRWVDRHPADLVTGILERKDSDGQVDTFNSVLAVGANQRSFYRKRHLVPFGEYLPMPSLLGWLIDLLQIPMSDFSAWPTAQDPVSVAGVKVGVSICYEDAFLEEVRSTLPDASVLVNVSEDAWFGDSFAPHQRMDMARMRALESGRPMIRAANTGVSSLIDHEGHVLVSTPQFVETVLIGTVQPMQGVTPFVRFGSWPVLGLCFSILVVLLLRGRVRT